MARWFTQIREASRLETLTRTLAALAIVGLDVFGVLVGRVGLFGLIGVIPLLLIVGGWRRRPHLSVGLQGADSHGIFWGPLPRWPVSADRILVNERARLAEHLVTHEQFSKSSVISTYDLGSIPASDQAYREASAAFLAQVDEHCEALSAWLQRYDNVSAEDETVFRLRLTIHNSENWTSHAEGVRLEITLPPGARSIKQAPSIVQPPEAPIYDPPPRRPGITALVGNVTRQPETRFARLAGTPDLSGLLAPITEPARSVWIERDDGSVVWAEVGDVYVGGAEKINDELLVQTSEPTLTLKWRAFSKGGNSRGTLTLRRPGPRAPAPAFGRLAGLLAYPNVALIDDAGNIAYDKRTSDPPLSPPVSAGESSDDLLNRLHDVRAITEWNELGLDPNCDGEASVVRVGEARPVYPPPPDSSS